MRNVITYARGTSGVEGAVAASLYEAVLDIVGTGGTIVPLGDSRHGALTGTTLTTVGDEQVSYTLSGAASFSAMDAAPGRKGVAPVVHWNGADEYVNTPDDSAWDGGNGSSDYPISVACWINFPTAGETGYLFSKFVPVSLGDWGMDVTGGKPRFLARDPSKGSNPNLLADSALATDTWHHVAITYDGTGGGNALADPNCQIYVNGSKVAATYIDDGGAYIAMEGSTNTLDIGADNGGSFYQGRMAGGPLGPLFVKAELSADAVRRLYELGRRALNL